MCLIVFAWRHREDYPLIVAANRDEFYDRPTLAADFWDDCPDVLGGRDLKEKGTWLGVTRQGRFAALTNYRDPQNIRPDAPSRGWLVRDYLLGAESAPDYLAKLEKEGAHYNGFSLVAGDGEGLYYYSNRGGGPVSLPPGVYGLSNHLLDTPWPKVRRARERFRRIVAAGKNRPRVEALFAVLADGHRPGDEELPDTGIGMEWERLLASIFIVSPIYGTRSSTVLIRNNNNRMLFVERQFNNGSEPWMTARVTL